MTPLYWTALAGMLQHLRYKKKWNLLIVPDPREFNGYKLISERGKSRFFLNTTSVWKVEFRFHIVLPTSMPQIQALAPAGETPKNANHHPVRTIRVVDTYCTDRGRNVVDVLIEILEEFPRFDLQSEKGVEQAIDHITEAVGKVGTTQKLDDPLLGGLNKSSDDDED
ncbi:hypothetical protein GALMADRAFT_138825 [Galerina marginata CBS 339.88]|uniref:Uncharacterized protein n=1 Tax=Galerina marginata (strain CBS 339.88) TaxID=685588 RepID=A0A067T3P9_GALM3|nr:hypothetical protein GALMADRAFT_138825 [Galerina marginata CBS 339.88]